MNVRKKLQLKLIYINWRKNIPNWFYVRCDTKRHATEICKCHCPFGGISSSVYQLKTQRNYVLNSTLPLNYSWEKSPWNPLNRGWVGPCTNLDTISREKSFVTAINQTTVPLVIQQTAFSLLTKRHKFPDNKTKLLR